MLILTRKLGENISIGDSITVSVLAIKGGHVKLGITASPDTQILREELHKKIKDINLLASKSSGTDLSSLAESWKGGNLKVEASVEDKDK